MSESSSSGELRPDPPQDGDEAATLLGFLDYQRATLAWKCERLGDGDLRSRLHPTTMSLAGLLRHTARVEDYWFTEVVDEKARPAPWDTEEWDAEWKRALGFSGSELRALWDERVERSRAVVAAELAQFGHDALGRSHPAWGGQGRVSLRWVLVHMIEEYARHNGHADLLRQSIDGETGE